MIHGLYRTAHGHCCLCGDERPLYTIRLTARPEGDAYSGPEVEVDPKREDVHSGACASCLARLGRTVSYFAAKYAADEAGETPPPNATEREPQFLTRGPRPQGVSE